MALCNSTWLPTLKRVLHGFSQEKTKSISCFSSTNNTICTNSTDNTDRANSTISKARLGWALVPEDVGKAANQYPI